MKVRITDLMDNYFDDSVHLIPPEKLPDRDSIKEEAPLMARKRPRGLQKGLLIAASIMLVLTAAAALALGYFHWDASPAPVALAEGGDTIYSGEEPEAPEEAEPAAMESQPPSPTPGLTGENSAEPVFRQTMELPISNPTTGLDGMLLQITVAEDGSTRLDFQLDQFECGNDFISNTWTQLIHQIIYEYLMVHKTDGDLSRVFIDESNGGSNPDSLGNTSYFFQLDLPPEEIEFISIDSSYYLNTSYGGFVAPLSADCDDNGDGILTAALNLELPDHPESPITELAINLNDRTYHWRIKSEELESLIFEQGYEGNEPECINVQNSILADLRETYGGQIFLCCENGDKFPLLTGVSYCQDKEYYCTVGKICGIANEEMYFRELDTITGLEICGETISFDTEEAEVETEESIAEESPASGDIDGDGLLTAEIGLSFPHRGMENTEMMDTIVRLVIDPEAGTYTWYTRLFGEDPEVPESGDLIGDLDVALTDPGFVEIFTETENYLLENYYNNAYLVFTDGTRVQVGSGDKIAHDTETMMFSEQTPLSALFEESGIDWQSLTFDYLELNGEIYYFE